MRIELSQELDFDDPRLEVPWTNPANPEHGYVNLKEFPEEVGRLEECLKYPGLGRLLREINAPGSALQSAKCDAWTTHELSADERLDFNLPNKMGSYVDVVFDPPEINLELSHHLGLGERVAQILRSLRVQAQGEIVIRRCRLEGKLGYASTIFIHAYGSTVQEAGEEWRRAMEGLGAALSDATAGMKQKLRRALAG